MLDSELEYYDAHLHEWLPEHRGKFVLIKGDSLVGFFASEEEAYEDGLRHFGNQPFLIRRVAAEEEVVHLPALLLGLTDARI